MRTALGAALVVLVVAAGCSDGDDDDAATNDDKGAAGDSGRDNGDDSGSDSGDNPDVGPTELGVEFPDDADDVFYDELSTCVDIRALILTNLSSGDEAVSDCLEDAVDDDLVKDYTVAVFISGLAEGDPERTALEERISEVVDPCMPT